MTISVAVSGATGRLGEFVCGIVEDHPDFELTARLSSASPADEGADASVLFDVTHPDVSPGTGRGLQPSLPSAPWFAPTSA